MDSTVENQAPNTIDTISSAAGDQPQQIKIEVDDAQTPVTYSSTVRVWGSAEEINLDFASQLRPTGNKSAKLKIEQRIIMTPWAAKRLCLAMNQAVARYEQAYGPIEVDPRKRLVNQPKQGGGSTRPAATPTTKAQKPMKLS